MDIKELMIGDWVNVKRGFDGHLTNERIKSLYGDKDELYPVTILTKETVSLKDILPIPLTEEILVKNGFKKESQTIDGDYCKYTLPGFALNWCDTDGFWYQNGDITPNHVHTLQHLLRLCCVQKEIEL